jgi:hypothetical protein
MKKININLICPYCFETWGYELNNPSLCAEEVVKCLDCGLLFRVRLERMSLMWVADEIKAPELNGGGSNG